MFVLEHWAQSAPSGFWPPRSCCTTSKVHTVRTVSFFHPSLWTGNCHSHQGAFFNLLALDTAPVQTVLPSYDHYSTQVQTLLPSGGPISGAIVTVADCAGRQSRTRDLSLGRRVRYQFAKEVTSLARPVPTLPAQRHSATFMHRHTHQVGSPWCVCLWFMLPVGVGVPFCSSCFLSLQLATKHNLT